MSKSFKTGIERLLHDPRLDKARAVGLLSHAAARLADGRTSAEALYTRIGSRLKALFGPEHGFAIRGGAGETIAHGRHPQWNIPVWSLYGKQRKPDPEMLRGLDLLIVDLQTLPFRPYTYLATLINFMEAAAGHDRPVLVADRPVPLPCILDGAMPDGNQRSFVCPADLPMAYGMTLAESALWLKQHMALKPNLDVIPMSGYRRDQEHQATWPPWTPPSPAIRSWDSAAGYLLTVFCEALPLFTNDRYGPLAFQVLYGPPEWQAARDRLTKVFLPGDGLTAATIPSEPKTGRPGIRFQITDRRRLEPVKSAVKILHAIQAVLGTERLWEHPGARPEFFDTLFGSRTVRERLQSGLTPATITGDWEHATEKFRLEREQVLLYGEPGKRNQSLNTISLSVGQAF